jgi:hypothetical protein
MRFVLALVIAMFLICPAESQVQTPPDTLWNVPGNSAMGFRIRNGWWFDSLKISMDASSVQGLPTAPSVSRFYQGTYVDTSGIHTALSEVGITIITQDSALVWAIGTISVKDSSSLLSAISVMAWTTDAEVLGIPDSTISGLPDVLYQQE